MSTIVTLKNYYFKPYSHASVKNKYEACQSGLVKKKNTDQI